MLEAKAQKRRPNLAGVREAITQTLQAELSRLTATDPRSQVLAYQLQAVEARAREARQ